MLVCCMYMYFAWTFLSTVYHCLPFSVWKWMSVVAAFWSYVQASGWSVRGTSLAHHWRGHPAQTQTCWACQHHTGNGQWTHCIGTSYCLTVLIVMEIVVMSFSKLRRHFVARYFRFPGLLLGSSSLVVCWKQVLDYHLHFLTLHIDLSSASLFREAMLGYNSPSASDVSGLIYVNCMINFQKWLKVINYHHCIRL